VASPGTHGRGHQHPSLSLLDVFVYAPAGLVMTVVEDLPDLAAKGRARITTELRSARAVGKFTVQHGPKGVGSVLATVARGRPTGAPDRRTSVTHGGDPAQAQRARAAAAAAAERVRRQADGPTAPPAPTAPPVPTPTPTVRARPPSGAAGRPENRPTVDLAIPGYDSLSASQVVRRLDSLGPAELEAVQRHEAATRGRRTILHRTEQLLGQDEASRPPGPTGPASD